jgi:NitT/TauT family transport system substrate-binding protein
VELVLMPFPDMIAALANGSVDAIVPPDPYGTLAIEAGAGLRLMDDAQSVGQLQSTHFLFSENFAENRGEVATRFLLATIRAARELQGDWLSNPELAQIVETELGFKRDLLARSILPQFPRDGVVQNSDVQVFQDAFAKGGQLTYSQPFDVTPFVNSALATRAREQLDARR